MDFLQTVKRVHHSELDWLLSTVSWFCQWKYSHIHVIKFLLIAGCFLANCVTKWNWNLETKNDFFFWMSIGCILFRVDSNLNDQSSNELNKRLNLNWNLKLSGNLINSIWARIVLIFNLRMMHGIFCIELHIQLNANVGFSLQRFANSCLYIACKRWFFNFDHKTILNFCFQLHLIKIHLNTYFDSYFPNNQWTELS